jgi:hypothetical protein
MSSKFVAPSQHPGSTRNTLSNYKIVSSRMKTFLERRNSCIKGAAKDRGNAPACGAPHDFA